MTALNDFSINPSIRSAAPLALWQSTIALPMVAMGKIMSPHDALFRGVHSQLEHARGTLRAMMPTALGEAIEWSTLSLRPGSFVDAALGAQHTDLLYSATWRDGSDALLHLLFEHQSTPPTEG